MTVSPRVRRAIRPLAAAAAILVALGAARAQDANVWAYLTNPGSDPKTAPSQPPALPLRANAGQRLVLRLVNPTDSTPSVSVEVRAGDRVVAKMAKPVNVRAGTKDQPAVQQVALVAGDAADGIALGRDFAFQVVVKRGDTETVSPQSVVLQEASDLLEVDAKYFGTGKALLVDVKFNNGVKVDKDAPPLPVELVIAADLIPGLKDEKYKKALVGALAGEADVAKLSATGLNIAPTKGKDGKSTDRIALHVGGVERALLLKADFEANNLGTKTFELVDQKGLRIVAPTAVVSGAKFKVAVQAFKINADTPVTLEFGQQIDGKERRNRIFENAGARVRTAKAKADEGGLLVTTTLSDWSVELDTQGIAHKCILRAKAGDAVATHEIIVDATGPEVGKPALKKGDLANTSQTVNFVATASDPDSGIDRVEFFLGAPPDAGKDGKYPAGTVVFKGKQVAATAEYTTDILLPEKPGSATVSVRAFNKVGMFNDQEFELFVAKGVAAGQLGSIKGKVTEGTVLQRATDFNPGPTVSLYKKDDKEDKGKAATLNKDGVFEFKNLAPGEYIVYSEKVVGNATKTATETVKVEGKKEPAEVTLKLVQPRATLIKK